MKRKIMFTCFLLLPAFAYIGVDMTQHADAADPTNGAPCWVDDTKNCPAPTPIDDNCANSACSFDVASGNHLCNNTNTLTGNYFPTYPYATLQFVNGKKNSTATTIFCSYDYKCKPGPHCINRPDGEGNARYYCDPEWSLSVDSRPVVKLLTAGENCTPVMPKPKQE